MLTKEKVQAFLKEIEVDDLVHNFQVMGNDVYIDMTAHSPATVSYTHLDVYKRQVYALSNSAPFFIFRSSTIFC